MVKLSYLKGKTAIIAIAVMLFANTAKAQTEQIAQQAVQQSEISDEQRLKEAEQKLKEAEQRLKEAEKNLKATKRANRIFNGKNSIAKKEKYSEAFWEKCFAEIDVASAQVDVHFLRNCTNIPIIIK